MKIARIYQRTMALLLLSVPALGVSLSPPVFLGESGGYNEISLSVTDSLTLHVYEAVPAEQVRTSHCTSHDGTRERQKMLTCRTTAVPSRPSHTVHLLPYT